MGKRLPAGVTTTTIRLWDVDIGEPLLTLKEHEGSVNSISFSPDGKTLARAGEFG